MRLPLLLTVISCLALATSCGDSDPAGPVSQSESQLSNFDTGRIVVHVYWDSQGIAGRQIDILELDRSKTTNESGFVVFRVPAGAYTVRAHDINRGGPSLLWIDTKVMVNRGAEVRLEVFDCLPCD